MSTETTILYPWSGHGMAEIKKENKCKKKIKNKNRYQPRLTFHALDLVMGWEWSYNNNNKYSILNNPMLNVEPYQINDSNLIFFLFFFI